MQPLRTPDERLAGARNVASFVPTTIAGAGHFLQEDQRPQLAQVIVELIAGTQR
jgi:hypothetical protein